jgi:hypothetical protein
MMQASRAFIAMLVLVASAFAPVLSNPLECVVIHFIACDIADLFVVLVAPVKTAPKSIVSAAACNPR